MPADRLGDVSALKSELMSDAIHLTIDDVVYEIPDSVSGSGISLLAAIREVLGLRGPKGGCNPQGQCGCCTVLVDGSPRVACVTPLRRVAGRSITTIDGLGALADQWADAFTATGASQCGFCTPGIICRLEGARNKKVAADNRAAIDAALSAHLCRCTGWQTIREAYAVMVNGEVETAVALRVNERDEEKIARRATIEGHATQRISRQTALGKAGFAEDTVPPNALVAVPAYNGENNEWAFGSTLFAARAAAGKVQGRNSSIDPKPPLPLPDGDFILTLRTSWTEPAYLETDASWCEPNGEPFTALANGGAFGGKEQTFVSELAAQLANEKNAPVRVALSREDVVRLGPKRPPFSAGVRQNGSIVMNVVTTDGFVDIVYSVFDSATVTVNEVDVIGPSTSSSLRGVGWIEATILRAAWQAMMNNTPTRIEVVAPNGAKAVAEWHNETDTISIDVHCGEILDDIVLRSYVIGAAHMGLSWVCTEGIAVADDGEIVDLTIRSFGVLRPSEMPNIDVRLHDSESEPINGSDAVMAAVAALAWSVQGWPKDWPTGRLLRKE